MSNITPLKFPRLELLQNYGGNFKTYFIAVYSIFESHFIKNKTFFNGIHVTAKKEPEVDGIHRTFYHITHEGQDEQNRMPDFARMERIRFPNFMMTNCPNEELLIWKNLRGRDTRVLIFNLTQQYLVVMTERKGFNLFWTAYYIEQNHSKKKLLKEYEAYIKAKTA
jgi:hypothetical protein